MNAKTKDGASPLLMAVSLPLDEACVLVKTILAVSGKIGQTKEGDDPTFVLHECIFLAAEHSIDRADAEKNIELFNILVEAGFDWSAYDCDRRTPFDCALEGGIGWAIARLLELAADKLGIDLDSLSKPNPFKEIPESSEELDDTSARLAEVLVHRQDFTSDETHTIRDLTDILLYCEDEARAEAIEEVTQSLDLKCPSWETFIDQASKIYTELGLTIDFEDVLELLEVYWNRRICLEDPSLGSEEDIDKPEDKSTSESDSDSGSERESEDLSDSDVSGSDADASGGNPELSESEVGKPRRKRSQDDPNESDSEKEIDYGTSDSSGSDRDRSSDEGESSGSEADSSGDSAQPMDTTDSRRHDDSSEDDEPPKKRVKRQSAPSPAPGLAPAASAPPAMPPAGSAPSPESPPAPASASAKAPAPASAASRPAPALTWYEIKERHEDHVLSARDKQRKTTAAEAAKNKHQKPVIFSKTMPLIPVRVGGESPKQNAVQQKALAVTEGQRRISKGKQI